MRVTVVVAEAQSQDLVEVELGEGASLAEALQAARVAERHPGIDLGRVGVWGRLRDPGHRLRDGDRVEVYRALRADAKAMRRARAGIKPSPRSRSGP